jgi:hypothetical protein
VGRRPGHRCAAACSGERKDAGGVRRLEAACSGRSRQPDSDRSRRRCACVCLERERGERLRLEGGSDLGYSFITLGLVHVGRGQIPREGPKISLPLRAHDPQSSQKTTATARQSSFLIHASGPSRDVHAVRIISIWGSDVYLCQHAKRKMIRNPEILITCRNKTTQRVHPHKA